MLIYILLPQKIQDYRCSKHCVKICCRRLQCIYIINNGKVSTLRSATSPLPPKPSPPPQNMLQHKPRHLALADLKTATHLFNFSSSAAYLCRS